MRFTRVRIKNFRILEDIDVDLNDRLVFLNGNNGHGKTSFQSAVGWCLYGDEELPMLEPGEGMISQLTIKGNPNGNIFPMSVEIDLDFPEHQKKVNLKREVDWNVEKERAVPASEKFIVRLSSTNKSSATEVIDPGTPWVQKWLPFRFKNFFLFDGEQMSEFFDSKTRFAVKDAVEEIAQVDLFLELKNRYEGIAATYENQRSRLGASGAQAAFKKWENSQKLLSITQGELVEKKELLKQKILDLEKVRKSLKNVDGAKGIIEKIHQAEANRASKKADAKAARKRFEDAAIARGLSIQLAPVFEGVKKQVEKSKAEGWFPIPFDIKAMEELLNDGKCLCGTDLQKNQKAHDSLSEHIDQRRAAGELGKTLQEVFSQVQILASQFGLGSEIVEAASTELDTADQAVENVEESLRTLRSEVQSLLAGMSLEEAASLAEDEANLAKDLGRLEEEIIYTLETEVPRLEEAESKNKKAYEKLTKQDESSELLLKKRKIAEALAESAEAVYLQAVERVREALQDEISKNFNQIIGGNEFTTAIDSQFTVKTLTDTGKPASLSSGQNMLKGYVFTVAMRQIVGLYFPLLVDTPLGRLSEEFRDELGILLTGFVESLDDSADSQVIFLMHDGEYTPYTQDRFSKLKPKELYFQWKVPKQQSIVGEGINPEWMKFTAWSDRKAGKI